MNYLFSVIIPVLFVPVVFLKYLSFPIFNLKLKIRKEAETTLYLVCVLGDFSTDLF